jgi:hypothetical protein
VPSRQAVAQLGTTQAHIRDRFVDGLEALAEGKGVSPLVLAGAFGGGKSHLLEYLDSLAEQRGFVTSYVVVSPEMPLGNAHVVLKGIAENARAPHRTGKALREMADDLSANPEALASVRDWARDADINDRFRALLHLYEEFRLDPEFRNQILNDLEGKPLLKTVVGKRLREIGQAAAYDLRAPRNPLLAHDRIRLLARFLRACGAKGLVVFFDEVERVSNFSIGQRMAAYQELGWWHETAEEAGAALFPVFASTQAFFAEAVSRDEQRLQPTQLGLDQDDRSRWLRAGIAMLRGYEVLTSASPEETATVKYRIKGLYEQAYGLSVPEMKDPRHQVQTSIRSQIRGWVTQWDLYRYDPAYAPDLELGEVVHDDSQVPDDALAGGDEDAE